MDAEILVPAAGSEVVQDDPDRVIGRPSRRSERHGHVQAVDDHVVERAVVPTAWRRPVLHHRGTQAGDEFTDRQLGVPAGDLVGKAAEVELVAAQLRHELVFGIARRHGHVGDHLTHPPPRAQRGGVPLRGSG
jgi:hypothetical protein